MHNPIAKTRATMMPMSMMEQKDRGTTVGDKKRKVALFNAREPAHCECIGRVPFSHHAQIICKAVFNKALPLWQQPLVPEVGRNMRHQQSWGILRAIFWIIPFVLICLNPGLLSGLAATSRVPPWFTNI